jgi:soluble cytochrome b562
MPVLRRLAAIALIALFALGIAPQPSLAGPVAEFESALRTAYADYRAALFHTNSKNAEASVKTIAAFDEKWSALSTKYASPPPQYADDPKWSETFSKVKFIVDHAEVVAAKGDLADAHEMLEEVRDVIEALHLRNGIIGFSERMNAFHHQMEDVLTKKYDSLTPADLGALREDMAVLAYLAAELKKFPPAEAAGNAEFANGLEAVIDTVAAVQAAARAGDPARAKEALAKVKPAYAKLFLKFG